MRRRLPVLLLLLSGCGGGASASKPEPMDIPMLGGAPLPEADRAALEAEAAASPAEAWRAKAWGEVEKRDLPAAMRDFNRAWLRDPESAETYWGFGILEGMQGRAALARDLFERGLGKDPKHPGLRASLAQSLCDLAHDAGPAAPEGQALLDRAEALCAGLDAEGCDRDPVYWTWAFVRAAREDWAGAWAKVKLARELGGGGRHPRFLRFLSGKMPEPG